MNIKKAWKAALLASLIVSLGISSIEYFIFSGGTIYVEKVEWNKVEVMPYGEAKEYLAERVGSISNFQSVINGTAYKQFWLMFLYESFIYFLLCILSCLLCVKFIKSNKAVK